MQEEKKEKGPWARFFKIVGINVGVMIAVIIGLLCLLSIWLGTYTRHTQRIDVPDLAGINADEAIEFLQRMGLEAQVIDSIYTDAQPGSVIEQMPVAGLPVKKGRVIYLTINAKSKRMVKMVDVCQWSSRQAQSRLRELGFVIGSVEEVASEFDDLVVEVLANGSSVIPGKQYPYHTRLTLRVGSSHAQILAENDSIENEWFE